MAWSRSRFLSSFYSSVDGWFSTLFDIPPQVRDGCAAGALPSARDDDPNRGILDLATAACRRDSHESILPKTCTPVFILDSGASCHAAGDMSLFSPPFRAVTPTDSAAAANYQARDGSRLAVAGVGTISFCGFRIPDVLYVPALGTGLVRVSVPQLAGHDYIVMFGGGKCSVKERCSGEIVGKGRLHDDDALYHLDLLKIPTETADAKGVPQDPVHPAIS